jgi:hypothetical protein
VFAGIHPRGFKNNAGIDNYSLDNHRRKNLLVEKYAGIFNFGLSFEYVRDHWFIEI